ncbi:MAG: MarR family transcriptional regulator [Spiribacter salinus]|uniref:MarR family transcriptional regulator n=1 Tax=Spiribacter salinus TaxID=1335746 RepID=A0A540VQV9_9GAMM|nr:MAG: MarR family transcriptional regulator [Spiribacter salinus]
MDHSGKAELDLSQFLPYRFNHLAERISEVLSRIYEQQFGIGIAEWRILAWLSFRDMLTAKQISEYAHMDKARISRAVHRLENRGTLYRTTSEEDRRVQFLRLTSEGEVLVGDLIPVAHSWEAQLLEALTAKEYRDLFMIMGKLERQLKFIEADDTDAGMDPPHLTSPVSTHQNDE